MTAPDTPATREYVRRARAALEGLMEPRTATLARLEARLEAAAGRDALVEANRALARTLHAAHEPALGTVNAPDEVREYWREDFARLAGELATRPAEATTLSTYRFKADCRLLALRRIPLGMWDLEVTGIPWRVLLAQRPRAMARLAWLIARAGGRRPYFRQHMAPHRMHLFNPAGRDRFLRLVADLLRRRPEIRGFISGGWYNDPEMRRVAPHLAYLRETLDRISDGIFRVGTSPDVVDDALANSFARRRLYEQGQYQPVSYMGVAPRDKVLRVLR